MAADNVHPAMGAEGDDFVYEGVKLQTAEDYKQHRKVQAIIDAQETVLDRRETAYEYFWEGRIGREDYLKAIRMAVERYLMLSKQALRENRWAQWYWSGEPPTIRGRSPFNENGELDAILDTKDVTNPRTDEQVKPIDIITAKGMDIKKPVLITGEDGEPIFGREPNILGILPMREVDRQLVFQGLESFWEAEDPIVRVSESVEDHPTRLQQSKSERHVYQIPEDVSMAAFDQINEFWWQGGMSVKLDKGQAIERGFDMSTRPEYRHTDGAPPV